MTQLTIASHPLIQSHLTRLRDKTTESGAFRESMAAIAFHLFYEATRNAPTHEVAIETPLSPMKSPKLKPDIVLAAILRAGLGFLDGILKNVPEARVGYLGLKRDPDTLEALSYYKNLPEITARDHVYVLDPMLATGHTAIAGLKALEEAGARNIHLIGLLASPKGIEAVQAAFPTVQITIAAVDPVLDHRGYIIPGLGDAGDRLYGTAGH